METTNFSYMEKQQSAIWDGRHLEEEMNEKEGITNEDAQQVKSRAGCTADPH
jgi:hypothetical protein